MQQRTLEEKLAAKMETRKQQQLQHLLDARMQRRQAQLRQQLQKQEQEKAKVRLCRSMKICGKPVLLHFIHNVLIFIDSEAF